MCSSSRGCFSTLYLLPEEDEEEEDLELPDEEEDEEEDLEDEVDSVFDGVDSVLVEDGADDLEDDGVDSVLVEDGADDLEDDGMDSIFTALVVMDGFVEVIWGDVEICGCVDEGDLGTFGSGGRGGFFWLVVSLKDTYPSDGK